MILKKYQNYIFSLFIKKFILKNPDFEPILGQFWANLSQYGNVLEFTFNNKISSVIKV